MATQTSNLGLTKPAYSETADIADINNNMDKIDAAVNGVQNGMAILANGNVHSAVTSGQYVYVRNHGTLAEGLYTATTNISTNATLSTSNLTAVPSNGALNTLQDKFTVSQSQCTAISGVSHMGSVNRAKRTGNVAQVSAVVVLDSDVAAGNPILTLPYEASNGSMYVSAFMDGTGEFQFFQVAGNSFSAAKALSSGSVIRLAITYICT